MKKLLALALVLTMALTVSVFAVGANPAPGTELTALSGANSSAEATVDVKIAGSGDLQKVYSVVVTWESLDFTYNFTSTDRWDPETHNYEVTSQDGGWADDTSIITVTNHSNTAIRAKAAFKTGGVSLSSNDVTASINNPAVTVNSAVGTEYANAPYATFEVSVDGVPSVTTDFTIGTVTITFEDAN